MGLCNLLILAIGRCGEGNRMQEPLPRHLAGQCVMQEAGPEGPWASSSKGALLLFEINALFSSETISVSVPITQLGSQWEGLSTTQHSFWWKRKKLPGQERSGVAAEEERRWRDHYRLRQPQDVPPAGL